VNIAVLGDLHGHFTLAYRILRRWEKEHNEKIDMILQVGDFGTFPPPFRVDRATTRFAKKDPDELSFVNYHCGSDEAGEILGPEASDECRISACMYFIMGNHEDFEFLAYLPGSWDDLVPVDQYGKMLYMRNGSTHRFHIGGYDLKIGCLGGIAKTCRESEDAIPSFYTKEEVKRLRANGAGIDVFLTHDVPYDTLYEKVGSQEILEFISIFQPRFHFCGHCHETGRKLDVPGGTKSFILNEVNFRRSRILNQGCFGMLNLSRDGEAIFDFVNDDWMWEYGQWNYREL